MEFACVRKRCMPKLVTNRPEKKCLYTVEALPTPEPQEGDVELREVSDWSEDLERKVEQQMKTLPANLLFVYKDVKLVVKPESTVRMRSSGKGEGDVEVLEREPEGEVGFGREVETEAREEIDDALSTISSEDNFSDFNEPNDIPEPYVPQPIKPPSASYEPIETYTPSPVERLPTKHLPTKSALSVDQRKYQPSPILQYAPYRPIMESKSYQKDHRHHWKQDKASTSPKTCHWWVKEILPFDPDYIAVRVVGLEKKQRDLRQHFGVFMTEHIPYGSPYWQEVIEKAGTGHKTFCGKLRSSFDNEPMEFIKYRGGKIKVTRNHTTVIIREKLEEPRQVSSVRFHKDETRVGAGYVFPTKLIPVNSRYYAELTKDFYFPRDTVKWVHVLGRDGVPVHFRLGLNGESLVVNRNGVTVQLFKKE